MSILFGVLIAILAVIGAALAALMLRFRRNQQRADEVWDSFKPQILNLEPVTVQARVERIDFLKHTVTLAPVLEE